MPFFTDFRFLPVNSSKLLAGLSYGSMSVLLVKVFFNSRTERIETREREDNWRKDEKAAAEGGGSWRARSVNLRISISL